MELEPIERVISGKGTIRIDESYNSALSVFLYADLLRDASNKSINTTWNPDKGFYAHITFCVGDYVLYALDMNFKQQVWEILNNQPAQNLLSLICAYDGILDTFVNLGELLSFVISRTNLITEHPYLRFVPDRIKFECFAECAIRLTLKGQSLVRCKPGDGTPTPPPNPPLPPPPEVASFIPIEVSPPYPDSDGDPDTIPFPTDEFPPFADLPFGIPCAIYAVTARFTSSSGLNIVQTLDVSGRILRVEKIPGSTPTQFNYAVVGEELNPTTGVCDQEYIVSFIVSEEPGGQLIIEDIVGQIF